MANKNFNGKQKILCLALLLNVFVWYFFVATSIQLASSVLSFNIGIIVFALVSVYYASIKTRIQLVLLSTAIGAFASILIYLFAAEVQNAVLYFVLGASLGYVLPFLLGIFSEYVSVEVRGRTGGLVFFISGLVIIAGIAIGSYFTNPFFLTVWRALSIALLLALHLPKTTIAKTDVSFATVARNRSFILYFVPWFMFSITEMFSPFKINQLQYFLPMLLIGCLSSLIGGKLFDSIGRKRVTIVAFVLIGIGYALSGIMVSNIINYLLVAIRGLAWGILLALFITVLWGDLSILTRKTEKYYAIGIVPFFIFAIGRIFFQSSALVLPPESLYSFLSFFLFLAVLPLIYAPETLPEKTIRNRDLTSYIEKAKRVSERQTKQKEEDDEESKEYIEAKKLAEKYY
jgi:MFS family permease